MLFYLYLARCSDGSLYTGSCSDISAREQRHNAGTGALYTRKRRPISIVYHEQFSSLLEARRREAQIKRWSRKKKERLVLGLHPTKEQETESQ